MEMFGAPERWPQTTNNFLWAEVDVLLPAFTGATGFRIPLACTFDMEIAAAKYLYSLPDGVVPLLFNFTGSVFYRGEDGRIQVAKVPWDRVGALRAAGRDLARPDGGALPQRVVGPAGRPDHGGAGGAQGGRGAAHLRHGRGQAAGGGRREPASTSWSSRCCTRATRSTRTRPTPPRTRRRRRSGSSTRPAYAEGLLLGARPPAPGLRAGGRHRRHAARDGALPAVAGRAPPGARAADRDPRPRRGDPVRLRRPERPRADAAGPDAARPPARARLRAQHHADGRPRRGPRGGAALARCCPRTSWSRRPAGGSSPRWRRPSCRA